MPDDEILALHKTIDQQDELIGILKDENESMFLENLELEGEVKHLRGIIEEVSPLLVRIHHGIKHCIHELARNPF